MEWRGGVEFVLGDMGVCAVGGIGQGCEPLESNMLKITDCGSQERVGGGEGRNVELWRVWSDGGGAVKEPLESNMLKCIVIR